MTLVCSDWRRWTYAEWNDRLLEYCLGSGARTVLVERIPATLEELLRVANDAKADSMEVVDAFVSRIKECIPTRLSFCGFCSDFKGWTPNSPDPPHFFGMLWLTCLVAYGFPDETGGFHDRMTRIFGRTQNVDCLKKLWLNLAEWTNRVEGPQRFYQSLRLPPYDDFRSNIGASWFLAFPHQHDRRRLRDLLVHEELVGEEEPPIAPVVAALLRGESSFSSAFREDLKNFVEKFFCTGGDARDSAFWRAVRQEAFASESEGQDQVSASIALLATFFDDDELTVYLACAAGAELPLGFSASPLSVETGGMSHFVLYDEGVAPGRSALDAATLEALECRLRVPKATLHIRRGVLVFQDTFGGEYRLVAGSQANEASVAFLREDRLNAFTCAYGGQAYPSRFPGWYQVDYCRVTVRRELPAGLEGIVHLQETMVPPSIRFKGGIRTEEGFVAFPGFLPRICFKDAISVELFDSDGSSVRLVPSISPEHSEWVIPDRLVGKAPSRWLVRARWISEYGIERESEAEFSLARAQVRYDYKRLAPGSYDVEASEPSGIEVLGNSDIPLEVTADDFDDIGPDLLELEPEARYLGPGLGEFSRTPMPGFDWLVTGSGNSPEVLLFVGDPAEPTLPAPRRHGDRGDWRHWRKAVCNPPKNCRAFVRLLDGRIAPIKDVPEVARVLRKYQVHEPIDAPTHFEGGTFDATIPRRWLGVVPDRRVADFVDALAALSVGRSGLRYSVLLDLLACLSGIEFRANPPLFFDLVRALVESGAIDVAHAQGRRAAYVVARRPAFVAYRAADRVRASLIGLAPATLSKHLREAGQSVGILSQEIQPPCKWLPSVLRMECPNLTAIRAISADLNLAEPRWLRWPFFGPAGLDLRPEAQALRDGAPHGSFETEARWDWNAATFLSSRSTGGSQPLELGVVVERRSHRERSAVYVVLIDGQPWGWTHIRNWALLHAYALRDGCAPFESCPSAPISRSLNAGVYLPLPLGRLCAILGDGLSGPKLSPDGISVDTYRYPVPPAISASFGHFLPVRHAENPSPFGYQ